jgi:ribose/xylose/arabinose/galactoside ABC-type transport system permease subunit
LNASADRLNAAAKKSKPLIIIMTETEPHQRVMIRHILRVFKAPEWGLIAGIAAVLAVIYFLDRDQAFFREVNIRPLLHRVALFGVLAIGAAVVIIAGGIDLSTGAVVALSSVVSAKLMTEWLRTGGPSAPPPSVAVVALAIALTLLLGLTIGLLHALMINWLRLPPFIATLATMAGLRSVATILCHNRTVNVPFDAFRVLGKEAWVTLAIFAGVAVFMSILMGWTVLGRHLFALGGNEMAARLSGLRTNRLKAVAYGLAGTLSALGGILFTGNSGQADSRLGTAYELTAITAAVVGGCSLSGGIGSIRGTVLGLLLTQIVLKATGIVVKGIDSTQIEGLVLGTVVLLAVAFNQRFRVARS